MPDEVCFVFNTKHIAYAEHNQIGLATVYLQGNNTPFHLGMDLTTLNSYWKRLKWPDAQHDDQMVIKFFDKEKKKSTLITRPSRISCLLEGCNKSECYIWFIGSNDMVTIASTYESFLNHWWMSLFEFPVPDLGEKCIKTE
jgi:hypothetical protein